MSETSTSDFKTSYTNFLELTRAYSLPISLFTWFVSICWAVTVAPSVLNVFLSFFAILFLHLATNLLDDYIDIKRELKKGTALQDITFEGVEQKARLIKDGTYSLDAVLKIIIALYGAASLIGLYFIWFAGFNVLLIALCAALLCIAYPFATRYGFGEVIIGVLFGPLLTYAVYFILTGSVSPTLQWFSISLALLNIVVTHIHSLMDFEHDVARGKKTLCTIFKTKENAVKTLIVLLSVAYLNVIAIVMAKCLPISILLVFLTLPIALELTKSMKDYIMVKDVELKPKWYLGPMEDWGELQEKGIHYFMYRFYLARNLAMIFCTIAGFVYWFTGGLM